MSAYSGIYTDMSGLADLRNQSQREPSAALNEVAGQFEALFTRMMLKTMRESSLGDSLLDSNQNKQYLEMFDNQVAVEMSRGRGLGLKEVLVRQLGGEPGELTTSVSTTQAASLRPNRVTTPTQQDWQPETPEAFIKDLLPHALELEAQLGISHRAVVAQAALESGWGKHAIRHADGSNAFNVFGIKADASWQGDRVSVKTLEFRDGIGRQETAGFRAYGSLQQAMADYGDFIRDNPRYRQAIAAGADAHAYAQELQEAGYATDPDYAKKLGAMIDTVTDRQSRAPLMTQLLHK